MANDHKRPSEGGAKQTRSKLGKKENPALQKADRQAVKNQSEVTPEDYPDRGETVV